MSWSATGQFSALGGNVEKPFGPNEIDFRNTSTWTDRFADAFSRHFDLIAERKSVIWQQDFETTVKWC